MRAFDKSYYQRFDWIAVAAKDVKVGDLYANNGSVTEVIRYPEKRDRDWLCPQRGEVVVRCGEGFSTRLKGWRGLVVGRLKATP